MSLDFSVETVMRGAPSVGYEAVVAKNPMNLRQTATEYQKKYEATNNKGCELLGFLSSWLANTLEMRDESGRSLREVDLGVSISDRLPSIVMALPGEAKMKDGSVEYFREDVLGVVYGEIFSKHPSLEVMWQGVVSEIKTREMMEGVGCEVLSGGEELDRAGGDGIALREIDEGWQAIVYQVKPDDALNVVRLDSREKEQVRPSSMTEKSLKTIKQAMEMYGYDNVTYNSKEASFLMVDEKGREVSCRVDAAYIGIPIRKAMNKGKEFDWCFKLSNGEQYGAPRQVDPSPKKEVMKPRLWNALLDEFESQINDL